MLVFGRKKGDVTLEHTVMNSHNVKKQSEG